jgi:hypothetical protein
MLKRKEKVKNIEAPSVKVCEFVTSKGFYFEDKIVMDSRTLCHRDSLSILRKDPDVKPKKYLFGLITVEPRLQYVGVIWFNDIARKADSHNWIFEVYGFKHLELSRKLAMEMVSTFKVNITVILESERFCDNKKYSY